MPAEGKPGYYAVIPALVRYDDGLPAEAKLLYGEITALANRDGCCVATNRYFAGLYGVSVRTVERHVAALARRGHIAAQVDNAAGGARMMFSLAAIPGTRVPVAELAAGLSRAARNPPDKSVGGGDKNVMAPPDKIVVSPCTPCKENNLKKYTLPSGESREGEREGNGGRISNTQHGTSNDEGEDREPGTRNPEEHSIPNTEHPMTKGKTLDSGHWTLDSGTHGAFVQAVERIWAAYPKRVAERAAKLEILGALERLGFDQGMGPERAVDYLTEAVEAYAAVVKGWPKADMRFVPLPARWFEEGRYSDDRAAWDLPRQQGRRSARDVEV